ncbi:MAG: hypothetical protein R2932_22925 [Caldilineaceae bacterium]
MAATLTAIAGPSHSGSTHPATAAPITRAIPTKTPWGPSTWSTPKPTLTPTSAGSLRISGFAPTPRADIILYEHGYAWVDYVDRELSLLYPNDWSIKIDDESVFIPTDDYGFELYWFDGDEDLDFLFDERQRDAFTINEAVKLFEDSRLDSVHKYRGELTHYQERKLTKLGGYPVLGGVAYETIVTNTWTDAKYLYLVNAIVRCGQYRFCFFEYAKIDDPFVPEDWALLDFFMAHVEFRDWPQSQQPVPPQPTPTRPRTIPPQPYLARTLAPTATPVLSCLGGCTSYPTWCYRNQRQCISQQRRAYLPYAWSGVLQ